MPKATSCFCFSFFKSKSTKKNNVQQDSRPVPARNSSDLEKPKKNKTIKIITNVKKEEIQVKFYFVFLSKFLKSLKILWKLTMKGSFINISAQYVFEISTVKI
jgi:hypothetical protein